MLSFASVQSIVMRAEMAASDAMPVCGVFGEGAAGPFMPGMTMGSRLSTAEPAKPVKPGQRAPHGHTAACPYCAAAAHAPVMMAMTPLRTSTTFVFTAFRVVASHGPRGPPARQPRARGPPAYPLTA